MPEQGGPQLKGEGHLGGTAGATPKEGFRDLFAHVPVNPSCPVELSPTVRTAGDTQPH